jgi:hypothetical protein
MMNMDVKKIVLGLMGAMLSLSLVAQTADKGTFSLEGGVGGNAYKLESSEGFGSTIGASWDFNLMAGYYFHERVNVNLEFERHTYLTDANDSTGRTTDYLGANRLGVGLRFAVVDRPKYQLLLGGTVGAFNFAYDVSDSLVDASFVAGGIYQTYGITNKFLFGEKGAFGLFLKAGIVNNPMTIRDFVINGEQRDEYLGKPIEEYKFNSLGYYLKFGLVYNILGK